VQLGNEFHNIPLRWVL